MNQYEKRNRAIDEALREHIGSYKSILEKCKDEGRQPDDSDRAEITEHMQAIETLRKEKSEVEANIKTMQNLDDLSRSLGPGADSAEVTGEPDGSQVAQIKSLGEMFVESKGYQNLVAGGLPGGEWKSGEVEVPWDGKHLSGFQTKGTLVTTPGTALTPAAYQPGVVETMFERLTVADLLPSAATSSPIVRYVVEGTATSGAAGVLETGTKPESTLGFTETSEAVQKIATILPVSDEMLEDAPQMQGYINQRLGLFVRIQEETQLLAGNGTAPNLSGILNRAISTWGRGTVDSNAVAIFKAANGVAGSAFLQPDAVIMNPANWQTTRLSTDTAGQFFGGGPFLGPYGGPQGPVGASYPAASDLWGMRLVVTNAIGAGTALVGSFGQAAQVFRRSGLSVEASNSHASYFASNITAIRAEERLALAVYRPSAFVKVTGLN